MRSKQLKARQIIQDAYTITELVLAVAIIGILSSVAIPSYVGQLCRSDSVEAESTISVIKTIITSYIDETATLPTSWDELSDISAIMSNNGIAKGNFEGTTVTLPSENYAVAVQGPTDNTYEITATQIDGCENRDIRACIDISNGASDLRRGDGSTNAQDPICS